MPIKLCQSEKARGLSQRAEGFAIILIREMRNQPRQLRKNCFKRSSLRCGVGHCDSPLSPLGGPRLFTKDFFHDRGGALVGIRKQVPIDPERDGG